MTYKVRFLLLWVMILVLLTSCNISIPGLPGGAKTPPGTLIYKGPTEEGIPVGGWMPGTDIRYLGPTREGAKVAIGDYTAIKKMGDSLDWEGEPASGVHVKLSQRVIFYNEEKLQVAGTADIQVTGISPRAGSFKPAPSIRYRVPVTYNVKKGERIPGTVLVYKGKTAHGAELGNIEGYPYRKTADSIVYEGYLRDNVKLRLDLRVAFFTESSLQVAGLALIGIQE
ncbi:MAG TPA: hypothetical protein EYP04_10550 [Anaerolineae bacterium]|nr:hypothetical protein [Anaerolineae bacterium]